MNDCLWMDSHLQRQGINSVSKIGTIFTVEKSSIYTSAKPIQEKLWVIVQKIFQYEANVDQWQLLLNLLNSLQENQDLLLDYIDIQYSLSVLHSKFDWHLHQYRSLDRNTFDERLSLFF